MEENKVLNIAIVGGGPGCKAIMDLVFGQKLSKLWMNLLGVTDTNPEAVGYRYAQEKGIYTTNDYRNLYKFENLHMIIELTGRDKVADEIARTKPYRIRLMDNVAARLFWDIFHIQEERVAERRRAEEALRESEQLLSKILSASPIGIIIAEKRIIKWVNQAVLEIFGLEREGECLNQNVSILYASNEEYERVSHYIYPYIENDQPAMLDAQFRRADGSVFDGHLKINVLDPNAPMKKSVATISDISWRKQAEQERIHREKLEGVLEMAGATCHELNQPLMAILGKSDSLLEGMEQGHPYYERIKTIRDQIIRMGELTNKIRNIRKYKTMEYFEESKIIDIHKASE